MNRLSLTKILLGSLISLQLTNGFAGSTLNEVYAKEEQNEEILLDEDGKFLQMIVIEINGYETMTLGYIYVKEDFVYLKDASDGRIYNLTKINENYTNISAIYASVENMLTKEQIRRGYITKEELDDLSSSFFMSNMKEWQDFFDILEEERFYNNRFRVYGCKEFEINDEFDYSFFLVNNAKYYDENLSFDNSPSNNYRLGILESIEEYPYYTNIYQSEPVGETNQMGIITGYYVLDENMERVATLKTQEEIDAFIETNPDLISSYTWKASYYNGTDIKDVLEAIDNNEPVSYEYTTRFIDYEPVCTASTLLRKQKTWNL